MSLFIGMLVVAAVFVIVVRVVHWVREPLKDQPKVQQAPEDLRSQMASNLDTLVDELDDATAARAYILDALIDAERVTDWWRTPGADTIIDEHNVGAMLRLAAQRTAIEGRVRWLRESLPSPSNRSDPVADDGQGCWRFATPASRAPIRWATSTRARSGGEDV